MERQRTSESTDSSPLPRRCVLKRHSEAVGGGFSLSLLSFPLGELCRRTTKRLVRVSAPLIAGLNSPNSTGTPTRSL